MGNIRALIDQARADWKVDAEFNPAWWLDWQLKSMDNNAKFDSRATGIFALPPQLRDRQEEKHEFLWGLRVAWHLVAYEQMDGENNGGIYENIRKYSHVYQTTSVTLPPLGVSLLDSMAEALNIPHIPGQATFNIYPFSGEATNERLYRSNSPRLIPTIEEVKRAITNVVDDGK